MYNYLVDRIGDGFTPETAFRPNLPDYVYLYGFSADEQSDGNFIVTTNYEIPELIDKRL